jgi:glyoxylase-like metal-dependent hydrolase (beta-lactamase superfamily II)
LFFEERLMLAGDRHEIRPLTRQIPLCEAAPMLSSSLHQLSSAMNGCSFSHGAFYFTVLSDGYITIPEDIFLASATSKERVEMLGRLDNGEGVIRAKTNIPVLRSKDDLIIFDIGAGQRYQPTDGRLVDNLKVAGLDPLAITKVVFTHAHPDHVAATLDEEGRLRFPNATYYVGAAEWNFWMDPDFLSTRPQALHIFDIGAKRDLGAIKDRVVMIEPGDDVVTGVRALDTAGHTPGHLSFEVSGAEGLIIAADVATSEIVAIEHPDWTFGYDTIPDLAIKNRKRLIDRAATEKLKLIGYHWTYPGVGFIEARGNAYRFVPAT